MATINLGRIKPVFRGAYSGATAYVIDDIVTANGASYICIQAHSAGTQAVSVTAYWTEMSAAGSNPQLSMTWDNATADADNGAGKIAWNHATIASATILYVDDADDGSANIQPYVDTWDAVTNTTAKGIVTITKEGTPSTFATFKVTGAVVDATGYSKIPVTHLVSNGTFSDGDGVGVNFNYSGLDGTDIGTTITTQGDVLYRDGSGLQRLAKPASNKYLQNTSGGVLSWEALTEYNDDKVQNNIALLGFKCAVNGSLAKYSLVDQIIDEYTDATGIDAGNSTNERLTSGVYDGTAIGTPTRTHDADATGTDGDYTWFKWTDTAATGSYSADANETAEWLIVAGGGGGGKSNAGGGGAGGYRNGTTLGLTGGNTYTVTVGAGGATKTSGGSGNNGSNSILSGTGITTITSAGGGGGGGTLGGDGGSGGGEGYSGSASASNTIAITQYTAAGEARSIQGYDGNDQGYMAGPGHGAGGGSGAGGIGADGSTSAGGAGGVGLANDIIETGTDVYYAGGGGGSADDSPGNAGAGGNGGGGAGNQASAGTAGTANTGGGGGGADTGNGGAGGSGIVILRVSTTTDTSGGDLTLQSTANTASSSATKADLIMLMENAYGTATLNTDIKGYVTANGGSNWTEGTLVDEGSWGTNKKILAFHDATVTGGTDLRYKITTHNQSIGSKETRIHATSIGWA